MEAHRSDLRDDPTNWDPQNWDVWGGEVDGSGKPVTKGFQGQLVDSVLHIVGSDDQIVTDQFQRVQKILGNSVAEVISLSGKDRPELNNPDGDTGHGHEQ
jgi:hypothetical protein